MRMLECPCAQISKQPPADPGPLQLRVQQHLVWIYGFTEVPTPMTFCSYTVTGGSFSRGDGNGDEHGDGVMG